MPHIARVAHVDLSPSRGLSAIVCHEQADGAVLHLRVEPAAPPGWSKIGRSVAIEANRIGRLLEMLAAIQRLPDV